MVNKTFCVAVALLLAAVAIDSVMSHSYITHPTSRSNQAATQTGCRGPACMGPCDSTTPRTPIPIRRGDPITAKWPRNNHSKGFIRWAWAKTEESNSHASFDNNVQFYSCHETGKVAGGACAPSNAATPNGGDSGPPDGSVGACTRSFSVPSHLPDGRWTLQWAWFGGAFNLGDYYSCIDYQVTGGSAVAAKAPATFDGGDFSNPTATGPSGKCGFFNTRKLHQCTSEPCFNGEAPGAGAGRPSALDGTSPVQTTTPVPATPAPATPPPATQSPATPPPSTPAPATPVPLPPGGGATAGSCSAGINCNDFSVMFSLTDKWATGMAGSVKATVQRAMSSWQLSFKLKSTMKIVSIWNCQLVSAVANADGTQTVTIRNPSWQTSVSAGQVLDVGFTANFPSGMAPTVYNQGFSLVASTFRAEEDGSSDSSASQASEAQSGSSAGLSTAAAVGIAVGGSAAVAALIVGALIAKKKLSSRRPASAPETPGPEVIKFSTLATASPAVNSPMVN